MVHVQSIARVSEDPAQLQALVTRPTALYEAPQAHPWPVADAPADYIDTMLGAIVGIEIPVQRWVGK